MPNNEIMPNNEMTPNTQTDNQQPVNSDMPILAKDRHIVRTLQQRLANRPAYSHASPSNNKSDKKSDKKSDNKKDDQQRLESIIARSHAIVQKRQQSIPTHLSDTLNAALPVCQMAQTLIDAIRHHQVIVVAGETGSGKTTQLPKLALMAGRGLTGQIGHTQPRRLAARSVATRIADELGEPLGKSVAFKVRFGEEGSQTSLIKLMTDGILLAELATDRYLTRYDTIIIDEAHERSLNIDFILGYLKQLLPKRPDLKLIITSATLDTHRFAEYFAKNGKPAPVFRVEGRSYPVEIRYRPLLDERVVGSDDDRFDELLDARPAAVLAAVEECLDDSRQQGRHLAADILIFAATESEIHELCDLLSQYAPKHCEILPLFARQSVAEQQRIFNPSGKGQRIIIATNVAETALTVPNIRYVIDLGYARISRYNYRSRIQRLPIEAISQASANQRAGRCGRVADGICIRLYSQEDFIGRPEFTEPEILRTNLASVILQMAALSLGRADDFDFITPPDFRLISDGQKLLYELGAMANRPTKTAHKKAQTSTMTLTDIGKQMAKMPIDPRLARMLIAAVHFDCVADMLIVVSALSVQDIRERPNDKQTQADQKHALFRGEQSDFLFFINAYQALFDKHETNDFTLLSSNGRKSFAKKHFFNFTRVREWQKTHAQLEQMMRAIGYQIDKTLDGKAFDSQALDNKAFNHKTLIKQTTTDKKPTDKNSDPQAVHYIHLHRALLTGLLAFVAKKTDIKGEYLMTKNQKARIFPASVLHKKGCEWLMAFEVVETSQVYLRTLAKIEPEWVVAAAGELLKYHYFEPHWSKKTGRVKAYAQISLFGLVLINKQLVDYEHIEPVLARQIFITEALVAGQLGVSLPFLVHNQGKIDEAYRTEEKLRRRDLLADEEKLYQFYDNKLPATITNRKALQDFLADKNDETWLYFDDDDVFNDKVVADGDFPEYWQLGGLKLPLSYVFDPSSPDDGVQIKIPQEALSQLDALALMWGIAGWRYELVVALLKSLPKEIRRQIVPIPDTAKRLFNTLDSQKNQGLIHQLCEALGGFGVKASPSQFDFEQIDDYLKPLVCVINHKGQVIDKSRDLNKLQQRHHSDTSPPQSQTGRHHSFPEHFHFVQTKHISSVAVQEFSALLADKQGLAVDMVRDTNVANALQTHKQGVLALIKARLSSKQKQLTAQIDKAFKMAFAPLGDLEKLKTLVVDASLHMAFDNHAIDFRQKPADHHTNQIRESLLAQNLINEKDKDLLGCLPLCQAEFELTAQVVLEQFLAVGQTVLKIGKEIYTLWQSVRGQLLMLDNEVFADNIADIEDQLDDLALADFVYKVDSRYWQHYPRYLAALKLRLDKLPNNLQGDSDGVYALDMHMERLANRRHDKAIADYRWAVEEYRINLFAQPTKTLYPISEKRLQALWQKVGKA